MKLSICIMGNKKLQRELSVKLFSELFKATDLDYVCIFGIWIFPEISNLSHNCYGVFTVASSLNIHGGTETELWRGGSGGGVWWGRE